MKIQVVSRSRDNDRLMIVIHVVEGGQLRTYTRHVMWKREGKHKGSYAGRPLQEPPYWHKPPYKDDELICWKVDT